MMQADQVSESIRIQAPEIKDAIHFDFHLPPINKTKLANGLPLYWLNAGAQEVVEIDWVFPAGIWQEQKPSVAQAVAGLLKNGTRNKTAHEIHESIEFYGANLKTSAGNDHGVVTLYCLTKHLPKLLPVVLDILMDATFPEDEVSLFIQNSVQRLLISERKCEFVADQKIDATLFGESHPYGRYTTREKIESLKRSDFEAFYKENYNLGQAQLFMAGNVGEKEVALLNDFFGSETIQKHAPQEQTFSGAAPSLMQQQLINDENGLQTAIRIGRQFPNRKHADYTPMVVLNTIFGGYFGSRLMSNIREDKGFTYGIYSSQTPFQHAGALVIHTEVGRDVADKAVVEIYKEMEKLVQEEVPEEELLLVKNYLLGSMLGHLDGPFELLQRWRSLILNGMDEKDFNKNIEIYKSVSPAELKILAERYFVKESFAEILVV